MSGVECFTFSMGNAYKSKGKLQGRVLDFEVDDMSSPCGVDAGRATVSNADDLLAGSPRFHGECACLNTREYTMYMRDCSTFPAIRSLSLQYVPVALVRP